MPPDMDPAQIMLEDEASKAGHDNLARLSTHGSNTEIPHSNHYIQHDQPTAVINAMRRVAMNAPGT